MCFPWNSSVNATGIRENKRLRPLLYAFSFVSQPIFDKRHTWRQPQAQAPLQTDPLTNAQRAHTLQYLQTMFHVRRVADYVLNHNVPPPTMMISYSSDSGRLAWLIINLLSVPGKSWRRSSPIAMADIQSTWFEDFPNFPACARLTVARAMLARRRIDDFRRGRSEDIGEASKYKYVAPQCLSHFDSGTWRRFVGNHIRVQVDHLPCFFQLHLSSNSNLAPDIPSHAQKGSTA